MLYREKGSDLLTDLRYLKYMKLASSSRNIKPESLNELFYVSCIPGIFPASRLGHINGRYLESKRLGVEVRRCLFGASYDGRRTSPT